MIYHLILSLLNLTMFSPTRTLAQVVRVLSIHPIPSSTTLEYASVLGWHCCVKKGEFKVGDLVLYFSVDAILDDNEDTAFLQKKRLKTKKMCGVYSQGLVAPVIWLSRYCQINHTPSSSAADNNTDSNLPSVTVTEGLDVTDVMKVTQWIPVEERLEKGVTDSASSVAEREPERILGVLIPRTSEDRFQQCPDLYLNQLVDRSIVITLKMDGCSATYALYADDFYICSRNHTLHTDHSTIAGYSHYFNMATKYNIEANMRLYGYDHYAVSGEIIGPKINSNRHKITETQYMVFNIYDISNERYVDWSSMKEICEKLQLQTVPLVFHGILTAEQRNQEWLTQIAESRLYCAATSGKARLVEGIVVKSDDDQSRVSFKIISRPYMLTHGEQYNSSI